MAPPCTPVSLLDYLKNKNPKIHCNEGTKSKRANTNCPAWQTPKEIKLWKEFEYSTLQRIYKGILNKTLARHFDLRDFRDIHFTSRQICDEESLKALLLKWNQPVVSEGLTAAQVQCVDFRKGWVYDHIHMVCGGQASGFKVGSGGTLRPDWAGIQTANNASFDGAFVWTNILPGDTKISTKWKSNEIREGVVLPDAIRRQWILPIMQVYTYCVKANARYGYIITDKELVVLRVRPTENAKKTKGPRTYTPKEATENDGILEYTPIPWESGDQLSVNLALWWLHLLAASNGSIEWGYPPLVEEALKPSDQTEDSGQEDDGQEGIPCFSQDTQPDTANVSFARSDMGLSGSFVMADLPKVAELRRGRTSSKTQRKRHRNADEGSDEESRKRR